MRPSPGRPYALLVLTALAGCGGGTEPSDHPGLSVISGAGVVDTAGAELVLPLRVRLLDSTGTPLAGSEILFEARECFSYSYSCSVFLAPIGGTQFFTGILDTTDASGGAATRVKLGYRAGEGRIRITATESGIVTTASYTVAPGGLGYVVAAPADSTLFVGAHYAMRASTYDHYGNLRNGDDISYVRVDGPITVTGTGTVTATGLGRARLAARSGAFADTADVTVVPAGEIALTLRADATEVRALQLDGSALRTVAASGWYDGGRPAWAPGGAIVYVDGSGGGPSRLFVADAAGTHRLAPASTAVQEQFPRVSHDGAWAYFQYGVGDGFTGSELWRVHLDGSGLERVGAPAASNVGDLNPDPSPDGTRLAYASTRPDGVARVVVRDLVGGVDHPLGLEGRVPRWSPSGEWIAYLGWPGFGAATIRLVRPDGSEDHQLSLDGRGYGLSGLDWSPDGAWLIAQGDGLLELIDASSGAPLPLGWSHTYDWPAWKPE
jgi:hypothetical protein